MTGNLDVLEQLLPWIVGRHNVTGVSGLSPQPGTGSEGAGWVEIGMTSDQSLWWWDLVVGDVPLPEPEEEVYCAMLR